MVLLDAYIAMFPKADGDSTPWATSSLCSSHCLQTLGFGSVASSGGVVYVLGA